MEITEQIVSDFREWYDEFSDTTKYSNPSVFKALQKAEFYTGSSRWGNYEFVPANMKASLKTQGLFAYAAHILSIHNAAKATSQMGQIPTSIAPVAGKSVASESVSFARSSSKPGDTAFDDMLSSTVYGSEFLGLQNSVSQIGFMV